MNLRTQKDRSQFIEKGSACVVTDSKNNKPLDKMNDIAAFKRDEIIIGSQIGGGAFSKVYKVEGIKLKRWPIIVNKDKRNRRQRKRDALENGEISLAMKQLKPSILRGKKKGELDAAMRHLTLETRLLASLSHENIINLYGVPSGNNGDKDNGFLLLEKLDNTLDRLMWEWRFLSKKENQGGTLFVVKANYALQLAGALSHMHKRRIIYRDLKPQNIGLKGKHTVKLFDFGLSRALPDASVGADTNIECFHMSMVGTPRYMSPEMFATRRYNSKADVYSWSIVFYEMLTLTTPYQENGNSHKKHAEAICNYGDRPKLGPGFGVPYAIESLLESAWDGDLGKRPSMEVICNELKSLLEEPTLCYTPPTTDKVAGNEVASNEVASNEVASNEVASDEVASDIVASDIVASDKIASDKVAGDKVASDKVASDKVASDKVASDKVASDKVASDKVASDKVASDKIASDKVACDKVASDKIASDKVARDKVASLFRSNSRSDFSIVTRQTVAPTCIPARGA